MWILELDSSVLPPISYIFLNNLPNLPGTHLPHVQHGDITYSKGLLFLPYKVITYDNICKLSINVK